MNEASWYAVSVEDRQNGDRATFYLQANSREEAKTIARNPKITVIGIKPMPTESEWFSGTY